MVKNQVRKKEETRILSKGGPVIVTFWRLWDSGEIYTMNCKSRTYVSNNAYKYHYALFKFMPGNGFSLIASLFTSLDHLKKLHRY